MPDSPQRKMKATVPTSGGSTRGKAARMAKKRRPGNAYRSKRNASGTPTSAQNTTVRIETAMLVQADSMIARWERVSTKVDNDQYPSRCKAALNVCRFG